MPSSTAPLDGPRRAPHHGGAAQSLIVLLHGYGADGRDLIDLAEAWGPLVPGAAFVSPHAPQPCDAMPVGRQWFALSALDPHELARGVEDATPQLLAFLETELARLNLPTNRLALMGFSQGAMMALNAGLTMSPSPAAIVSCSGLWSGITAPGLTSFTAPPPVLLLHGALDEVVPPDALEASAQALARAGVTVESHMSLALGHGIDGEGIRRAGAFLKAHLDP